jgi:hypothetical protein
MNKYEDVFPRYGEHSPTSFDNHIEVDGREDWYLMPVSRTRDSEILDNSNFIAFLKEMGGESETVEVHRFGHWGPGWYEIIIVDPADEKAMDRAYDLARALEDYPVLDEEDLAEQEMEDINESWDNYGDSEVRKDMIQTLEAEITDDGDTVPDDPKQRWCKNWGMDVDLCGCGDCILMENERLYAAILVLEDLDSGKLRELARECGMTEEYSPGSSPFHSDFSWYPLLAEIEDIPVEKKI